MAVEEDDDDEVPLPVKKDPTPKKEDGCCAVLVKGERKGQKCGEKISNKYSHLNMCVVHGRKV
jgi:hypothetical protein